MSKTLKKSTFTPIEEEEGLRTPTTGKKTMKPVSVVTPERGRRVTKPIIANDVKVELGVISIVTPAESTKPITPTKPKHAIEPTSLEKDFHHESPDKGRVKLSTLHISKEVEKCYKIVRKATGALGGNGHTGAIYGELTMHSMQRVANFLVEHCEMGPESRFIDIGSGLGKPNFHVAQSPAVRLSLGIELEELRWKLAMHNLLNVLPHVADSEPAKAKKGKSKGKAPAVAIVEDSESDATVENKSLSNLKLNGGVNFISGDIDIATSTDPFTHIYQFDLGFPPPLQQSIARKFNSSVHAKYLISYRPPHRVLGEYGYAVEFMDQLMTSMHGSGEGHMAYFYRRINKAPKTPEHPETQQLITIPGRIGKILSDGEVEPAVEVYCDNAWADAVRLAVGPLSELRSFVRATNTAHLASGRPVRKKTANQFLA